jgi:hypothetical protein
VFYHIWPLSDPFFQIHTIPGLMYAVAIHL